MALACAADLDVAVGRVVYTQMLNARGGVEADITVTRLSETAFLMVTPAATRLRDETRLRRLAGDMAVTVTDVTAGEAVMAVMGPRSRDVLSAVVHEGMSNEAHPFGTAREVDFGMGRARLHRLSYVGELGWEVYVSADMAAHAFETIIEAGRDHGLTLAGLHAMDSLRLEKGFRHMGHDITPADHVIEAGLGFACRKTGGHVGAEAVAEVRTNGPQRRLLQFRLDDPDPLLFHAEPILRNGEVVGHTTSGGYGHSLGGAIGLGYVPCPGETPADVLASTYEIEVAGCRIPASASLKPFFDPSGERMRA
jgi:4-methylaminobutanoate oxidase (formaldehyde-forming)